MDWTSCSYSLASAVSDISFSTASRGTSCNRGAVEGGQVRTHQSGWRRQHHLIQTSPQVLNKTHLLKLAQRGIALLQRVKEVLLPSGALHIGKLASERKWGVLVRSFVSAGFPSKTAAASDKQCPSHRFFDVEDQLVEPIELLGVEALLLQSDECPLLLSLRHQRLGDHHLPFDECICLQKWLNASAPSGNLSADRGCTITHLCVVEQPPPTPSHPLSLILQFPPLGLQRQDGPVDIGNFPALEHGR